MNPIWYEIPSVVVVLVFVGIVLIRAFTAPVSQDDDRIDIFMRRQLPGGASAADARPTEKSQPR
ncbi:MULTISPECIES: hypothetical protein [Burkholderiaceae]|uniref:Uncharacterized protein n=1 Tax=Caballeronia sordidicola TaxID=196367 RepID=A0A242MAS9_CABSO|nr:MULTISPECIES: hypothetical protein [Burkholderiaceae]AMH43230.1 hypothetical protein AXG89_36380 [Burkholderia sp. PAMC 26561]OTP68312.1 hypothetical protein PAMC26577_33400 [Caballeronia sordidicola]